MFGQVHAPGVFNSLDDLIDKMSGSYSKRRQLVRTVAVEVATSHMTCLIEEVGELARQFRGEARRCLSSLVAIVERSFNTLAGSVRAGRGEAKSVQLMIDMVEKMLVALRDGPDASMLKVLRDGPTELAEAALKRRVS